MNEFLDFIVDNMPSGVFVLNPNMEIKFCSRKAVNFLNKFELPLEITNVSARIFKAITESKVEEEFPGENYITKKLDDYPSKWTFRILIHKEPKPLIVIHIIELTLSNQLDLNNIRQHFGLTRTETDVLRRVLDGLENTEIAEDLEISEQIVEDYSSSIYNKVDVKNREALTRHLLNSPN